MARRWIEADDLEELRAEVREQATLAMYAQMLTPDLDEMANESYGRLRVAAERLGLPEPPPLHQLALTGAYTPLDTWLDRCGL
ncbi:hypothetical protein ACGFI3_31710 [Nonomuraea wenchangensis]|uniref:hypothetical protein n=1 Tax=Nonomuraea wenchangensis TaxID=568860 RepID=UPI0037226CE1